MALFQSKEHLSLRGINDSKYLTSKKEVLKLPNEFAEKIYIPLVDLSTSEPINIIARIGDEVKIGSLIGIRKVFEKEFNIYSTVSGKIIGEGTFFNSVLGRSVKHFVIQNNFKYEINPVVEPFDYDSTPDFLIEAMRKLSCIGLGGAGFPTFIKYQGNNNIETLILNGVECEPFLTTDNKMIIEECENLILGAKLLMKACGAKKTYICIKKDKHEAIKVLSRLIEDNISLMLVKNEYPMGWERLLIKNVIGKEYQRFPLEVNVIVNNVQTAIEFAKSSKTGCISYLRCITVSGNAIRNQANVIVPIGTRVDEVIRFMGGYKNDDVVVLLGGPMCSKALIDDKTPLLGQNNGIIVLNKIKRDTNECLRCGSCTDHCPANLQPVEIKIAFQTKKMDRLISLKPINCINCGLCSYVCPSHIEVTNFVKSAKILNEIEIKKQKNKGDNK